MYCFRAKCIIMPQTYFILHILFEFTKTQSVPVYNNIEHFHRIILLLGLVLEGDHKGIQNQWHL